MRIRDWSSDVCSSGLVKRATVSPLPFGGGAGGGVHRPCARFRAPTPTPPLKGRGLLVAAIAVLTLAGPAHADTLIDNVNGITLDQDGQLNRFTGLVIDTQGKVKTLLSRKDKRPERPD